MGGHARSVPNRPLQTSGLACSASVPTSPARPSGLQDHRGDGELEAQTERNPSHPSNTRLASHAGLRQHLAGPRQGVWPQRGTSLRKKVSADLHYPKTESFQVTEQKDAARKRCGLHFQMGRRLPAPPGLAGLPWPPAGRSGEGGPAAHTWSPGCCSCQRRGRGRMTGGLGRHHGLQGSSCPPPLPTPAWAIPRGLGSSGEAVCR